MTSTAAPVVPGYVLGALLGTGSSGSVWRARAARGGLEVAVKVVQAGPEAERELAVLEAVVHPHVVRLHHAVVLDDGRLALVLDLVDGGTLASVVAARGHLSPGETVTVLAPLASAVGDLHADGVQHGDLAPGNVLFDSTGRPVLTDLGTSRVTGEPRDEVFGTAGYVDPVVLAGGRAGPASDVYGLGALAWYALTGAPPESMALRGPLAALAPTAPDAMVAVVEAAVGPDQQQRPGPAELARALYDACPAEPVWRPHAGPDAGSLTHRIRVLATADGESDTVARHRTGRRRRPAVPAAAAVATLATMAVTVAIGAWWWPGWARTDAVQPAPTAVVAAASAPATTPPTVASSPRLPSRTTTAAPASRPSALTVVRGLNERRARLFADPSAADVRAVASVSVAGSPAAAADSAALETLSARGLRYRGLSLRVGHAQVVTRSRTRMVVDVVSSASAYVVLDAGGRVTARVPAASYHRVRLELRRPSGQWRVQQVLPV